MIKSRFVTRTSLLSCAAIAIALAACDSGTETAAAPTIKVLVNGGALHGIEGVTFATDGMLYVTSGVSNALYKVDPKTGAITMAAPPPDGEGDDIAVGPANTPAAGYLVWTSPPHGRVMMQKPGGQPEVLMDNVPNANPAAVTKDGSARFFFAQREKNEDGYPLWEVFPVDKKPPRLVVRSEVMMNGFDFGPDGKLYAPWQGMDEIKRVDIDTGAMTVAAKGVGLPVGVDVDPKGNIYSVDSTNGDLWVTAGPGGPSKIITNRQAPLDNVTVGPDGTLYATAVADSRLIAIDPNTGAGKDLVPGSMVAPWSLSLTKFEGKDALLVADPFGHRFVDIATGKVTRSAWKLRTLGIAAGANDAFVANLAGNGRVKKLDRSNDQVIFESEPIAGARGLVMTASGDVIVADTQGGKLVKVSAEGVQTIAEGLRGPSGLALDGADAVLVAETAGGAVTQVKLAVGAKPEVAKGLDKPSSVTRLKDGRIAVSEPGPGTVAAIDAKGTRTVLAQGLKLGVGTLRAAADTPNGLAVGPDGTLYVSSPMDNTISAIALAKP